MQRLLVFCLFLLAGNVAHAQFFSDSLEQRFFRDVVGNRRIHVSKEQADWKGVNLGPVSPIARKQSNFHPSRLDTILTISNWIELNLLIDHTVAQSWNKLPAPRVKLVDKQTFAKYLHRISEGFTAWEPPDWSAFSRPIFWNGGRNAMLYITQSPKRQLSNTYTGVLSFYELLDGRWTTIGEGVTDFIGD